MKPLAGNNWKSVLSYILILLRFKILWARIEGTFLTNINSIFTCVSQTSCSPSNSNHLPRKPTIDSISWQGPAIFHFEYQIYKQKMHGRKYVWVIHTPDKYGWWKRTLNGVNCTPEQVNEGAKGIIQVNYMWLSKSKTRTMSGMVSTCENRVPT